MTRVEKLVREIQLRLPDMDWFKIEVMDRTIQLDGYFSIETLKRLTEIMEKHYND